MRRRTKRGAIAALVAAAALFGAVVSTASAERRIGPKVHATSNAIFNCLGAAKCTFASVKLPQTTGAVRSRITGTITRWRVNVDLGSGPMRLQVLRRTTNNKPGVDNDEFEVVRQTAKQTVPSIGPQGIDANLKIRKGQFIGLQFPNGTRIAAFNGAGARFLEWVPTLTPKDPSEHSDFQAAHNYILFNATVTR